MTRIIGIMLCPTRPAWEQKRKGETAALVLLVAVTFAISMGAVMYWMNIKHY